LIIEGNAQILDQSGNSVVKNAGTILGSSALVCSNRQLFGAKAVDTVTCMALGRASLKKLEEGGAIENIFRREAIKSLVRDKIGPDAELQDGKILGELFDSQLNTIIDHLEDVNFEARDRITSKGSKPQILIVLEGEVAITEDSAAGNAADFTMIADRDKEVLRPGRIHGGKSMANDAPMQDNIEAISKGRLLKITHADFIKIFGSTISEVIRLNEIKKVLSDVFLFKNLNEDQMDKTIRALKKHKYGAGEVIVRQGDTAKLFFLIQRGTIKVLKDGVELRTLGRWDYFGERGLLLQEKRSATCKAETSCQCLVLEDKTFGDIVGMFRRLLEHRMYLQDLNITMSDLQLQAIVGRGSFGIVNVVNHRKDPSKLYALKCVNKAQVVAQHQQKAVMIEREIHAQCYHPCIVQFIKTFQDKDSVYFLTEFLGGGDLFFVIRDIGSLSKAQSQFYAASVILALEYLHARSIMYRDLKPENVLLDGKGNAKLVDFGCCKKGLRTTSLVGTPEYLAPEVILGKGYTHAVDWWSLGVILHEFVVGPLPFGKNTEDQLELFREVLEARLEFPAYVTDDTAISLISGLLERAPDLRMGSNSSKGAKEIQEHRYFFSFEWQSLLGQYLIPPWTPDVERIKSNWERCEGEPLLDADATPFNTDLSNMDQGMEWAVAF